MDCSGKREISGEVKKEWVESVGRFKFPEGKEVEVVKREERLTEMKTHMSKASSFEINDRTIICSSRMQSWFIDRELKSVCLFL